MSFRCWMIPTSTFHFEGIVKPKFKLHSDVLYIFTDGSATTRETIDGPAAGGWATVLQWNDIRIHACGGGPGLSVNEVELLGLIRGMQMVKRYDVDTFLCSDSQYALNAIFVWSKGWRRNRWRKADGQAVKNRALIEEGIEAAKPFKHLHPHWVKGHAGIELNEVADVLAGKARRRWTRERGEYTNNRELIKDGNGRCLRPLDTYR